MKTPDEAKRGLECCSGVGHCFGECPYYNGNTNIECIRHKSADALAYIQQLERSINIIAESNASAYKKRDSLEKRIIQLQAKCHQLELERDAAVESIRNSSHCCDFCKHNKWGCTSHAEPDGSCFEWRGVKEE